jgi:uncharacterized membrane protein
VSDVPPPPPPPPPYGGVPQGSSPDVGAAITYGWNKFTENVGSFIAIMLAPFAVLFVLELIGIFVVRGYIGFLLFFALALLVGSVAYLGVFNAGLMATSGQRVEFNRAFQTDRWGEWIAFSLLYGLMLFVGYLLCFIGALFVIAFWGLAPFYFLEQGKGATEALSASFAATRSTPGLPVALGVLGLIGWVGGLVCGIGSLVTYPIAIVGAAFLYRAVVGQTPAP